MPLRYENPCPTGITADRVVPLQPVPEELQSGPGFGYVVAFRPLGAQGWMQAAVTSPEASRYVFKNESIPPFSPYQVKVGVYNNRGEGPFSPVTTIHSAEEGRSHFSRTSATQIYRSSGNGCGACGIDGDGCAGAAPRWSSPLTACCLGSDNLFILNTESYSGRVFVLVLLLKASSHGAFTGNSIFGCRKVIILLPLVIFFFFRGKEAFNIISMQFRAAFSKQGDENCINSAMYV